METDELERSPFGRRLSLLVHKLPKRSPLDLDWELERGFHLSILSENLFELNLRPRGSQGASATPPILEGPKTPGAVRILVWQKAPKDDNWEEFAQLLSSASWEAGLILSRHAERGALPPIGQYFQRRMHWAKVSCPVLQIFQDTPQSQFFAVEKNLFVLGRVGRRLARLSRARRWLPW